MSGTNISSVLLKAPSHLLLEPVAPPKPPELLPPQPPSVPLPFQLVEQQANPRRQRGLFDDLLAGRPEAIISDAQDHPDAYDPETVELLQQLMLNKRELDSLTAVEKDKLDQATMEFFSSSPASQKGKATTNGSTAKQEQPGAAPKQDPVDGPVLDAFWWT